MFDQIKNHYKDAYKTETLTFKKYLELVKKGEVILNVAERLLKAIGEPELVDTANDTRLKILFQNKVIPIYKPFKEFYGLENVIIKLVSFLKHAAQGLEESKQILYLLGSVGGGKSSIAEKLKELMEDTEIYILCDVEFNMSPIFESPVGVIPQEFRDKLGIKSDLIPSPWAVKRLDEYGGDILKFKVIKTRPSRLKQIAITKTEPGDENNQDISTLVGKMDIRKLEHFATNDPDAYSYSGGLCRANQGILDFVEMFKAPIKVLHPLLTATQERNYKPIENIGAIPFDGIVIAHSNEAEWDKFRENKANEAFLDRINIIKVPYCLRVTEETKIYEKLIRNSTIHNAPCAPETLENLATFSVLTRISAPRNSSIYSKLKVYNGESIKDKDPKSKSLQEYQDNAEANEGFTGLSTRSAFKILSETFNYDINEISADPVTLFAVIKSALRDGRLTDGNEVGEEGEAIISEYLQPEYEKKIGKDIQTAYIESYDEYGQSMFDRYILYADFWIQDQEYRDNETGQMLDPEILDVELTKIEKPADISNPKDFRHEVVNFCLRYKAKHGENPVWTSYGKLKRVIESHMFNKLEDLLPVISFAGHKSKDDKDKHEKFVDRMCQLGYTKKQVRRLSEWYIRYKKSK